MKLYIQKLKRIFSSNSFLFKTLLIGVLLIFAVVLLWLSGFFEKNKPDSTSVLETMTEELEVGRNIDLDILADRCNRDIDSILFNFGIKKEWIKTVYPDKDRVTKQDKPAVQQKPKKDSPNVKWFSKDVSIPGDITTAEINLDLTTYMNFLGLKTVVNEDIRTTAINCAVYSPSDSDRVSSIPLAKIKISPTDKISRDAGSLILIINRIDNLKKEILDKILDAVKEFSFIFPRNPEDIELQNKLIQQKRDVLVNVTVGTNDNYDADFRIGMDEKEVREKVKSINSDFPSVKTAVITKSNAQVPNDILFRMLTEEFRKNGIHAYYDTLLTKLLSKDEEDSDNKIGLIVNRLKDKASRSGKVITELSFSNDEFLSFIDEVQKLKKRGYKFFTFSQYILKEEQKEKEREENEARERELKKEIETKKKQEQTKTSKDKKKK